MGAVDGSILFETGPKVDEKKEEMEERVAEILAGVRAVAVPQAREAREAEISVVLARVEKGKEKAMGDAVEKATGEAKERAVGKVEEKEGIEMNPAQTKEKASEEGANERETVKGKENGIESARETAAKKKKKRNHK